MQRFVYCILVLFLLTTCSKPTKSKDSEPESQTLTFINKTDKNITIVDNSGQNLFSDFVVFAYSDKQITLECPSTGCDIDWYYTYSASIFVDGVCICDKGDFAYDHRLYTFGYCPNVNAPEEESCESCRNQAACE
jgi:hypothetical protein